MYSRILVPLDCSELAEKALPHAQGLARSYGAEVHLVHVFTRHPDSGNPRGAGLQTDYGPARVLELSRQLEEARIQYVQEYLEHVAIRLKNSGIEKVQTDIEEGLPHEHIIEYARRSGADLVVMTIHGHGGLKRLLIGSVTDRVVRSGEVPVLVIPT